MVKVAEERAKNSLHKERDAVRYKTKSAGVSHGFCSERVVFAACNNVFSFFFTWSWSYSLVWL